MLIARERTAGEISEARRSLSQISLPPLVLRCSSGRAFGFAWSVPWVAWDIQQERADVSGELPLAAFATFIGTDHFGGLPLLGGLVRDKHSSDWMAWFRLFAGGSLSRSGWS